MCGPAEGDGENGDTAQGVTAETIQVSTFSDPGFDGRPGLNQEMFDSADAFTAWCNEAGGINGREIELRSATRSSSSTSSASSKPARRTS